MPKLKAKAPLKEMYRLIVESLQDTITDIDKSIMYYRTVNYHNWDDDDFLESMAEVIFSSYPLNWETVEKRWPAIKKAFLCFDVNKVANYTDEDIKRLMKNPDMINYEPKVRSIVQNAKRIQEIIKEYGSFANYVCFYPYDLKQDLDDNFYYLGDKTVLDFMKEMGFPVIKDDIHIRRVLHCLGLTNSEDVEQEEILRIGKEIAFAVGERMPVIDCVFWSFGHYICKTVKPEREKCGLTKLCREELKCRR